MFRGSEPRGGRQQLDDGGVLRIETAEIAKLHEGKRSQPWAHAAFRPCGTRVAFAATNVAALSAVTVCL